MKVSQLQGCGFGAVVTEFDARQAEAADAQRLKDLVYENKLLIFKNQQLTKEEYLEFARKFGRPQVYFQDHYHHPEHPEIFVSSNVPVNGKKVGVAGTGRFWHSDYSFFDEPLSTTFVYPQLLPGGRRETCYVDMAELWRGMPERLKEWIRPAKAFHEATWYYKVQPKDIDRAVIDLIKEFRELSPGATHPMVMRHPVTRRDALYVSEGFTTSVVGMTHEESKAALEDLFEYVRREQHVQRHVWKLGDLLYWDNRQLIHMACNDSGGEPSVNYRIGVYDGLPFYVDS